MNQSKALRVVLALIFTCTCAAVFATAAPTAADRYAPTLAPIASTFADELVPDAAARLRCDPGETLYYPGWGEYCADLQVDDNNCGTCALSCKADEICVDGICEDCPAGEAEWVQGTCQDILSDDDNCGSCGYQCVFEQSCVSGSCECPGSTPDFCVEEGCVDLDTDFANCGSCASECDLDVADTCSGGTCQCGSGPACTGGEECVSGTCKLPCNTSDPAGGNLTCFTTQECVSGYCEDITVACSDHGDCPDAYLCDACTTETFGSCSGTGSCIPNGDTLGYSPADNIVCRWLDWNINPATNFVSASGNLTVPAGAACCACDTNSDGTYDAVEFANGNETCASECEGLHGSGTPWIQISP